LSSEDQLLAEMAIEKYAEAKGLDVKAVKEKWLPILQADKEKDPFTKNLLNACSILGQIKEVGKGLDSVTQDMLSQLSSVAVQHALNPQEGKVPDEDEKLVRLIRRLKVLDNAFTDPDEAADKIAVAVSKEIGEPLAEALKGLNAVLEKLATKAEEAPQVLAVNPELAALSKSMEDINSRLEEMGKKIESGGAGKGEVEDNVESMMAQISNATEKAQAFLVKQGYTIVAEGTPATFEDAKLIVEERGFKLQDQRVTRADAEKMAKDATEAEHKKHADDLELKLEEKKIEAAEKIVGSAIEQVMKPFQYFLQQYLDVAMGGPEGHSAEVTSAPQAETPAPVLGTPAKPKVAFLSTEKVQPKGAG